LNILRKRQAKNEVYHYTQELMDTLPYITHQSLFLSSVNAVLENAV